MPRSGRPERSRGDGRETARPYGELARMYDELVGDAAFDCWRANFEQLVSRYELEFRVAADVACGTGHALEYLSGRCERVYGVDASPSMLERAARRTEEGEVILLEQSFTGLELPEQVDLLTCNFDSLNYVLTEAELAEAVSRFGRSVGRGGYCIFDMNTTRELEQEWGTTVLVHRLSSGIGIWEFEWDPEARINTLMMTNFILQDDGLYRMSEEVHRERAYDTGLVLELLTRAGFDRADAFDARDLAGLTPETRRVQFVARRGA